MPNLRALRATIRDHAPGAGDLVGFVYQPRHYVGGP